MKTEMTVTVPLTGDGESNGRRKPLLLQLDGEVSRRLVADLAKAEREENCIRRAVLLMVVLFLGSVAGLAYGAILLPDVISDVTHPLTRGLIVLGLASLISVVVFLGCLIRRRTVLTGLDEERRRLILELANDHRDRAVHSEAPQPGIGLRLGQRRDLRQDWVLWRDAGHPALQRRPGR
jgi:hypothetical protein